MTEARLGLSTHSSRLLLSAVLYLQPSVATTGLNLLRWANVLSHFRDATECGDRTLFRLASGARSESKVLQNQYRGALSTAIILACSLRKPTGFEQLAKRFLHAGTTILNTALGFHVHLKISASVPSWPKEVTRWNFDMPLIFRSICNRKVRLPSVLVSDHLLLVTLKQQSLSFLCRAHPACKLRENKMAFQEVQVLLLWSYCIHQALFSIGSTYS